jgi:3-hydroxy-D-aspartate aldolase
VAGTGVRFRPHAKSHAPGDRPAADGPRCGGVCCQKVGEAEAMVYGGVPDVLVTNEIVGASKIRRLVALATQARIAVCADPPGNIADLSDAAAAFGVRLPVLVEVNTGSDRCGVDPGEPAVTLATQIARAPGLRFAGLHAYHGSGNTCGSTPAERADRQAAEKAHGPSRPFGARGLEQNVTGGDRDVLVRDGERRVDGAAGRPYIFLDVDYGRT